MKMNTCLFSVALVSMTVMLLAESPADRWAAAIGGLPRLVTIKSVYREANIDIQGLTGTIRAWHTSDGRYRKEERVGSYVSLETFDGTAARTQIGQGPVRTLVGDDLARARSTAFANWNAVFFVLFPDRHRAGNVTVEGDFTIAFRPANGIDWRVTLDPVTSRPKTMSHKEGERTVNVTFVSYEDVDGISFEKEIQRSNGDPRFNATIRFTKTVVNPPIDMQLFLLDSTAAARGRR